MVKLKMRKFPAFGFECAKGGYTQIFSQGFSEIFTLPFV
jgi:hypothetical protein